MPRPPSPLHALGSIEVDKAHARLGEQVVADSHEGVQVLRGVDSTLFQLGGASEEEAAAMTETYVAMDKALAEARMSQEDMADFTKIGRAGRC